MPITSRLSFGVNDRVGYQGFRPFAPNVKLEPGDRVIAASFEGDYDMYFVDCEAGIGELRRYFREQFEHQVDLVILHQDRPTWIVALDYADPDNSGDILEVAVGPFYSEKDANAKRSFEEKLEGFLGGSVLELQKPG